MFYLSVCSFQVLVCAGAASHGAADADAEDASFAAVLVAPPPSMARTVAENRGVKVSKRVSSTRDVKMSTVNGWSTSKSTP